MPPVSSLWTSAVGGDWGRPFGYNFNWSMSISPHHFKVSEIIYPTLGKTIYSLPYTLDGGIRKKYISNNSRANGDRIRFVISACDSLNNCSVNKTVDVIVGSNNGDT
jgi:hypothetical protein